MEYRQADKIRGKSLLELISEKKFKEDQSLGSSIAGAFSDKMKAKAVGIKEKLDPLNMVKSLAGNGVIGKSLVTMVGRASGRSEENIRRFGGYGSRKRKLKERNDPNFTTIGSDEDEDIEPGDSVANVIAKLTSFMEKKHELEKKDREIDEAFRKEQIDEDDRRHKELVTAIRDFTKGRKSYTVETKDEGLGWFDGIKKWIMDTFGDFLVLKEFLKPLVSLGGFMAKTPALLSFLAYAVGLYLAKEHLDETEYGKRVAQGESKLAQKALREKQTDFSKLKLSKDEAQAVLDQPDSPAKKRDIESFGGVERLQAIAAGKPDPGGVSLQKPINNNIPTNETKEFQDKKQNSLAERVKPKPTGTGTAAKLWEETFSKDYNTDGTKKQSVPQETKSNTVPASDKQETKPATTATPIPPATQETKPAPTAIPDVKKSEQSDTSSPQTVPAETKNVYNNIVTAPKTEAVAEVPVKNIPELIDEGDVSNQNSSVVAVNNNVQNLGSNKQDIVNTASTSVRGPIKHRVVPV